MFPPQLFHFALALAPAIWKGHRRGGPACYSWGMKKPAAKPAKGAGAAKSSKNLVPDKGDIVIKGKSFEPFKKGGKK